MHAPVPAAAPDPAPGNATGSPEQELAELAEAATAKVAAWLRDSAGTARPHASAERLAAVLSDDRGLDFTVGFVDRVIRTEDQRAAAQALAELAEFTPAALSALDRAQITAGSLLGRLLPQAVVPAARARMRSMVGHMIVDAREEPFGKAVAELKAGGHRLNINLLGEAVLGEAEADHHLEETRRLLARDDVDYVSIKVSSIASQLSMWGFDETVDYVVKRLTPLYLEAAEAPAGAKFINLDMEEYRDLRLTMAVFSRLLSLPETRDLEAGIVLQAYLPDALGAMQELAEFAARRVDAGGAGIKVRLVKGANLAMERVHAELAGWPLVTCDSKQATDANYKLVLHWLLDRERMRGLRIGVAGHNLFDIAFAHLLGRRRGVCELMEFEMLQGMATEQAEAVSADTGQLLLYVPAVRPQEFDVAISYLVRRLEENAAQENFMSGILDLAPGNETFRREEQRFRDSLTTLSQILTAHGHRPPGAQHRQDRAAEELAAERAAHPGTGTGIMPGDAPGTVASDAPPGSDAGGDPSPHIAADGEALPPFRNEPDTNPALAANQEWARAAVERAVSPGWLDAQPVPDALAVNGVDALVATAREAGAAWAARPAIDRARILYRAADLLAARRGHLVSLAAAEVGKAVAQSDPEVSEAIDFARYYAHRALELEQVEHARFTPDRVIVVTPPWNFPLAIPLGSTVAALAAGAAVIHKPSGPAPHCAMALLQALWDAGVPREVLHGVSPDEGESGRLLISHPEVDRVILTGASDTAATFAGWRPDLAISAETSGKNALLITPSADRDLAVADLVHSAFGHAGQKCSAASLGILTGSVYDSERFRRQLVDAASSLVVDWPENLSATVGPLTEQPSAKLHRALTELEPGERWLLKPRQLDETGRLWSPGIKDGVRPGSFFHLTECFGPVLGLMRAKDLDEGIRLQNATEYGLTAGIHSLEPAEVRRWLAMVQAGNVYVNRGITGAIVQRQSFGGWKKSSVGLGSKAGGPNYLMQFGTWQDTLRGTEPVPGRGDGPAGTGEAAGDRTSPADPAAGGIGGLLGRLVRGGLLPGADLDWLRAAIADDSRWWEEEFGHGRDHTGLQCEANVFRYLPAQVTVRLGADADAASAARALAAGRRAGASLRLVVHPESPAAARTVAEAAAAEFGLEAPVVCDDEEFAAGLLQGRFHAEGQARVRHLGAVPAQLRGKTSARPEIALLDDPVTASGRVELRYWLKEQAVSMTLHRFGNPSPAFHALAEELRR
ncbi:proline dehydrogenase family protein [Sediminivirga luteola]|uniref:proline dehydrogenase family protein n=1 Tax=Sediminivirga luteola TaxID=1774748 RepID=UPI001F56FC6C|nr:bifunctional proline dehydrogenase/L-glutamate gamma-semialdehyde dehydrogenase [Sediminivirga luteola]MCI2265290.1 bifunctional proline dehydrogenase/L-glutamate gamma-semialdehyde dehydrogenase [Sediminivirga luteola]